MYRARLATLLAALAGFLLLSAAPTAAATPVYSGTGWKIWTSVGIHSLGRGPYVFTFANASSRTRLTPYVKAVASQLTEVTGVRFTVSTTIETPPAPGGCPPEHHMVMGVKYRPYQGQKGISHAWACWTNRPGKPDHHAAWGGWAWIDSEYWSTNHWFSTNQTINTARIKNTVTHEIGHLAGLAHPNKDLDHDGTAKWYECVETTGGYLPVMCSPHGGYTTASGGGKFTSRDTPGLRQLVKNYGLS